MEFIVNVIVQANVNIIEDYYCPGNSGFFWQGVSNLSKLGLIHFDARKPRLKVKHAGNNLCILFSEMQQVSVL